MGQGGNVSGKVFLSYKDHKDVSQVQILKALRIKVWNLKITFLCDSESGLFSQITDYENTHPKTVSGFVYLSRTHIKDFFVGLW